MNILILGSGGREHAIGWKLAQSPEITNVFIHPGNPGTQLSGFKNLGLPNGTLLSLPTLIEAAKNAAIDLVVIGPEVLLEQGYSDAFRKAGFRVFGPSKEGALLETSKVYAKEFLTRAGIPTAPFKVAASKTELIQGATAFPVALKLDGLAAGKGVVIAKNKSDAVTFAENVFENEVFGKGPHQVLIEDFIEGVELSFLGLCDGGRFIPLATCTDHKRVGDGDTGPNTGGMGVISPSPYWNEKLGEEIQSRIVLPLLSQMKKERLDYRGVLYIGIMIDKNGTPAVLEFNARFGDPETQAIMKRLESDLLPALLDTANGTLTHALPLRWTTQTAVLVVAAAEGYPEKATTGDRIDGWDDVDPETTVFFSGVSEKNGSLTTSGGRVLGVCSLGRDTETARQNAYGALGKIKFRGMHFRKDIGLTKIKMENT